jgi:hypothetical protein
LLEKVNLIPPLARRKSMVGGPIGMGGDAGAGKGGESGRRAGAPGMWEVGGGGEPKKREVGNKRTMWGRGAGFHG